MTGMLRRVVAGAVLAGLAIVTVSAEAAGTDRIVVAGGAVTEIVYRLGAEDRLTAVDTTSLYPPAADRLPKVGYFRTLSAEGVLSVRPSLVIAVEDAGPASALEQIRAAGVPVVDIPDAPSVAGIITKIEQVATVLGLRDEGRALIAEVETELADLAADVAATADRPSVLFLLTVGKGAPLAAGRNTAADGIVDLAGGRNALAGFDGYKPISVEAALAAAPDYILMMEAAVDAAGGPEAVLALDHVRLTPAGRAGQLIAMDGMALLGFGPRTPQAARTLFEILHPDAGRR